MSLSPPPEAAPVTPPSSSRSIPLARFASSSRFAGIDVVTAAVLDEHEHEHEHDLEHDEEHGAGAGAAGERGARAREAAGEAAAAGVPVTWPNEAERVGAATTTAAATETTATATPRTAMSTRRSEQPGVEIVRPPVVVRLLKRVAPWAVRVGVAVVGAPLRRAVVVMQTREELAWTGVAARVARSTSAAAAARATWSSSFESVAECFFALGFLDGPGGMMRGAAPHAASLVGFVVVKRRAAVWVRWAFHKLEMRLWHGAKRVWAPLKIGVAVALIDAAATLATFGVHAVAVRLATDAAAPGLARTYPNGWRDVVAQGGLYRGVGFALWAGVFHGVAEFVSELPIPTRRDSKQAAASDDIGRGRFAAVAVVKMLGWGLSWVVVPALHIAATRRIVGGLADASVWNPVATVVSVVRSQWSVSSLVWSRLDL